MKRSLLLARVQPLADRLASDLVDMLEQRIAGWLGSGGAAFDVALSAAAGELVEVGGNVDSGTPAYMAPDRVDEIRTEPAPIVRRDTKPSKVILPNAPARVAANGKKWPSCSICGRVGVTARSHPHEKVAPLRDAAVDPMPARPDRVAAIAEAAATMAKREGALPTPRSSFEVDGDDAQELDFE